MEMLAARVASRVRQETTGRRKRGLRVARDSQIARSRAFMAVSAACSRIRTRAYSDRTLLIDEPKKEEKIAEACLKIKSFKYSLTII